MSILEINNLVTDCIANAIEKAEDDIFLNIEIEAMNNLVENFNSLFKFVGSNIKLLIMKTPKKDIKDGYTNTLFILTKRLCSKNWDQLKISQIETVNNENCFYSSVVSKEDLRKNLIKLKYSNVQIKEIMNTKLIAVIKGMNVITNLLAK